VGGQGYTKVSGSKKISQVMRANDGLKHSEMMVNEHYRSLPSTARLDRHTQLITGCL